MPAGLAGPTKALQRFLCMDCGASFTFERKTARPRARFTDEVIEEAVRLYIQGLSSYRVLAVMLEQRFVRSVSRFTLNGWAQELGARAKTPLEVSMELQPKWGGFLGIDGKVIRVKGDKRCLLIGVDHPTQDLVHAIVVDSETADGFARLATELTRRVVASAPTSTAALYFVAATDLIVVVPSQMCRYPIKSLGLESRKLPFQVPAAQLLMKWHQRSDDDRAHAWLRDQFRAAAAEIYGKPASD